ncbi:hypothetical protein AXF42_Ash011742 [Apostasia shenzhenica]|uniref:Ribosomal RNA-processing protein 12-like conserved domain-containing protein n=1 Tax=Apostasia shenzhenica TaxID=1088818 RepID=A0A2H9ZUV9_9ASPA|nr:hypothetical protein AXF42_Ash011742 [Apostasia shenzhenica]
MEAQMEMLRLSDNKGFLVSDIAEEVLDRFQNSQQEEHHNLCATVGAISQALKEQGLSLSPVAYFAASVSSFIRLIGDPSSAAGDPDITAILAFLSVLLPRVSPSVIRSKGALFSEGLVRVLEHGSLPADGEKAALKCLSHMLVIGDKVDWSSVSPLFGVLLNYVTDHNVKVRRQSHSCLSDVLQSFQGSPVLVGASEGITSSFERFLLLGGSNPPSSAAGEPKGAREVLFVLVALKDCIHLISTKSANMILKYCIVLMDMQQSGVMRSIMEIMQTLCSGNTSNFSAKLLLDLLCSFALSIPQKEKSADDMASIVRLLNVGIKKIYSLSRETCIVKLPDIFISLRGILSCEHEEAIFSAAEALKSLIGSCIDENLVNQGVEQINLYAVGETRKSGPTIIEKICAIIEGLLDFRYCAVWDVAFQIISAAFDQLGRSSSQLMVGTVLNLTELQSLPDDEFVYRKQLHECLGSALAAMGPENFLSIIPLNLKAEDISDTNVWLEREGHIFSARSAEGLIYSLWSVLPAFCNYPTDTSSSFKAIHDELCNTLRQEPELHGIICSSLQILIQQNRSVLLGRVDTPGEELSTPVRKAKEMYTMELAQENLRALQSYSSKFLSVLSEVFLEVPNDSGGCLQSTIHSFAFISDKAAIKNFFKKNMIELLKVTKQTVMVKQSKESASMQVDNLPDEDFITRSRALRLDLAVSLLPGLDKEEIDLLFSATKPALQDEEGLIQKKAYKILSIVLKDSEEFWSRKLDELLQLMILETASCHFSAKRYRFDCLFLLIVHISKEPSSEQKIQEFISAFLTEILLALKETNKKTRNKAYDLLVEIGHVCGDENRGGKRENLRHFFNMVAGGLVSETPHMVSAAIKGLARLTYEFSDLITAAYTLLPSSFLLLQRKNREIIKANLGLIKVLVARSKSDGLETHLKGIVEGLLKWKDETKNHFKAKIKSLIEMLARKCGLGAVKAVMPEEHMKLLKNIRKINAHKERITRSQVGADSLYSRTSVSRQSRWNHTRIFSDFGDKDGNDECFTENEGTLSRTSFPASRAWLRSRRMHKLLKRGLPEDHLDQPEDDPLDLLDQQKTRSLLRSSFKPKRKLELHGDEPEVDFEGRIIVRDEWDKPKKQKSSLDDISDIKSLATSRSSTKSLFRSQRKRQKTESGWSYTGADYTSKKASGDLKKKGKLEPYAYWPLDRKLLNRRSDRKAAARKGMKSVMLAKNVKKLEGKSAARALFLTMKRRGIK